MSKDQIVFDEMFMSFEKICKGRGYFFYKFESYKQQIERCLRSDDDSEVVFGIYLAQELSEEQQIELLEPLVDIFIGDIVNYFLFSVGCGLAAYIVLST